MPPKRGKIGPPYTDIPDSVYVVVLNPWSMNRDPRQRKQDDFDRIAAWARFVLQQAGLGGGRLATIDCIYSTFTRDEIIIQFSEGTDIIPLLGEHRWANFGSRWTGSPDDPSATCVFIYNWRNNGDPSKHNWTGDFPNPMSLEKVPAKSPYPTPSWVAPPSTLVNFVHPIPRPPNPPPNPPRNPSPVANSGKDSNPLKTLPIPQPVDQPKFPEQPIERLPSVAPPAQPVEEASAPNTLFKPYEPPSQYPSRIAPTDQPPTLPKEPSTPPLKFVKKLDPYELDEDAFNALRSPEPAENTNEAAYEDVKPSSPLFIKAEVPEVTLENCDNSARHNYMSGATSSSRPTPLPAREYQPSAELAAEMNIFFQGMGTQAAPSAEIRREEDEDEDTTDVKREEIKPIIPLSIKREVVEVKLEDLGGSIQPNRFSGATSSFQSTPLQAGDYQPSAELAEEMNKFFQGMGAQQPPSVAMKREFDEAVTTFPKRKRIKIEED
ncbi:hypothetical protein JVU11DRAFT_11692 [Chiua virens]|nr:hypothetical protein JVU11DRAFT_11692 [Chiua virens]